MTLLGLSHPRAITRIPDPIHGVVELTLFDRDLVDTRSFQRLHFVLQQSVNYVSFPANKNSRFPHSIGTAHLSGRLFSAGLSNASATDLREFLERAGDFLSQLIFHIWPSQRGVQARSGKRSKGDKQIEELLQAHKDTISGCSSFLHAPLMRGDGATAIKEGSRVDPSELVDSKEKLPAGFIIDTYWQAIRIYSLSHDIGHLPMSHAFEESVIHFKDIIPPYQAGDGGDFEDPSNLIAQARSEMSQFSSENDDTENNAEDDFYTLLEEMLDISQEEVRETIQNKALHETRSYGILNNYLIKAQSFDGCLKGQKKKTREAISKYSCLINNLALCIIYSHSFRERPISKPPAKHSFLLAIRQLVDGEVDGDRLDYTLRDCHAAGARFGEFDCEGIVRNSLLVSKMRKSEVLFSFGFGPRAVSGIEQFFEARYQSYKYLVHHRTASRSNKAVEAVLERLFAYAFLNPGAESAKSLERFGFLGIEYRGAKPRVSNILPALTDNTERLDDAALRTLLHEILRQQTLDDEEKPDSEPSEGSSEGKSHSRTTILEAEISTLCKVVLYRELQHTVTLFKDETGDSILRDRLGMDDAEERAAFLSDREGDMVEFMSGLREKVTVMACDGEIPPVSLFYEVVRPKCFVSRKEEASYVEELVWVSDPSKGPIRLDSLDVSPQLARMATSRTNGGQIRLYATSYNLKLKSDVVFHLENLVLKALEAELSKYRAPAAAKKN